jgi:hypothetical protein
MIPATSTNQQGDRVGCFIMSRISLNKSKMKFGWMTLSLIILGVNSGCGIGPGFTAASDEVQDFSASASAPPPPPSSFGVLKSIAQPDLGAKWIREEEFMVAPQQNHRLFEGEVKIPFGWLFKSASSAVRLMVPMACQSAGVLAEGNPDRSYAPGEIPCGQLEAGGYKRILGVEIPASSGQQSGFDVTTGAVEFPILMSREQFAGAYRESRLDSRAIEMIASSPNFGDDISLRFEPTGDSLKIHVCAAIPGFKITAPERVVDVRARKNIGFVKFSASTGLKIDMGAGKFDHVRGCFVTDVTTNGDGFSPSLKLSVSEKPRFQNAEHTGIKIRIQSWWLRLVDKVMGWFKASFRQKVIRTVNGKIRDISENELETGAWFARIQGEEILETASTRFNRAAVAALKTEGVPMSGKDLREHLKRQCALHPLFEESAPGFTQECLRALGSVKFSVQPFFRDPKIAEMGCYDHFANLHQAGDRQGRAKWWSERCQLTIKLQVHVLPGADDASLKALDQALRSIRKLDRWLDETRGRLGWSEDDKGLLPFITREVLKNGDQVRSVEDLDGLLKTYRPDIEKRTRAWGLGRL